MRLLYISCHSVLEYDEVRMFTDMGHEVFSLHGAYQNAGGDEGDRKRPGILNIKPQPRLIELGLQCTRENILPEILDWADAVVFMHQPQWVMKNLPNLVGRKVIFRSIGQSTPGVESTLKALRAMGIKVVRYSPSEATIPGYAGHDAIIRFNKRPEEWGVWKPSGSNQCVTFTQSARDRGTHCGYPLMEHIAGQIPTFRLYGNGNDGVPFSEGLVTSERQRQLLTTAGCYFSAGTHPASYTLNFMEAWLSGIPMVAVGNTWGQPRTSGYPWDAYEVPELITNRVNGIVAESKEDMVAGIMDCLVDPKFAQSLGEAGRQRAIELFDERIIAAQWEEFLNAI